MSNPMDLLASVFETAQAKEAEAKPSKWQERNGEVVGYWNFTLKGVKIAGIQLLSKNKRHMAIVNAYKALPHGDTAAKEALDVKILANTAGYFNFNNATEVDDLDLSDL